MITENTATTSTGKNDLLIVSPRNKNQDSQDFQDSWISDLRNRYDHWNIRTCETYLSAIADLSRQPARTVLAPVNPSMHQLGNAVSGLREAAGDDTNILLYCTTENEPIARETLSRGADDYVLTPINNNELDSALGVATLKTSDIHQFTATPSVTMQEMTKLSDLIANLGAKPMDLIDSIASLVRLALGARGVTVIVQGAAATSGHRVTTPILTAPITGNADVIGQLTLSEKIGGAYTPADTNKLNHYATLVSHILSAASSQRNWQKIAVTDECSGLPNRRFLFQQLDEILTRAKAEQFPVTVLMFDVDDFKKYNDEFGHDTGDEIIRATGELFRQLCRSQDVVTRYGGDEFVVVFWDPDGPRTPGSKHPQAALSVLQRAKKTLETKAFPALGATGQGSLTISGGLATYPWDGSTKEELIHRADEALLAAKRAGKNRIFLVGQE